MASRKSGIPVKSSTGPKTQTGAATQSGLPRPSSIPVKKAKNANPIKSGSLALPTNSPKQEPELQEEIKRLENEVKDKDSAINDLNEKLMERLKECQVLREENEAARENLNLSTDHEVSGKLKDLENLLNEKETFIENMLTNKHELERKFEVELDMLKNQHEIEVLSLQQRLEDAHQEKIDELQTSLKNEKIVSARLQEEIKGIRDQNSSAEINILHEELMSTKLRYENQIFELKQELEMEKSEKEDLVRKQEDDGKEIDSIKEKHKEEMETLRYVVQEKDILINDLKRNMNDGDKMPQDTKLCSDEDVTTKLDELRRKLTIEHEHNLELANELWRKNFEEHQSTDLDRTRNSDENQDTNRENTDKLLDEISDLKKQLQEANELQEEQTEILEVQEKEIEEFKESNQEFQERYTTLYKEMETKWQNEFSESEIIEKIKSHYEMEIERLHGELEDIQNENSNLKTELDLIANDFDGGHSRVGGPVRRPSVTARLDMKAEIEDYKVQLATLERDLQHALNQNERLKLENSVRKGTGNESKLEELNTCSNKVDELQAERDKLIAERDEFRAKFEESKTERKKLEKVLKSRDEERRKVEEQVKAKNKETASLKEEHETGIKTSEAKVLEMKEKIAGLTSKCEISENELASLRETLAKSENRERNLEEIVQELKGKELTRTQEFEEANSKISTLEGQLSKMTSERDTAEELNKIKDLEGQQLAETRKRVTELENILAQGRVANEAFKVKYDKLLSENETKTSRISELEVELSQAETDFENTEVSNVKVSRENDTKKSEIDKIESRLNRRNEEYESLTRKYEGNVGENESKSLKISEIETLLQQKNLEHEILSANYSELRKVNESSESRIASLEAEINEQKLQFGEVESLNNNLKNDNEAMTFKICEMENLLKQSKDECVQLKRNYEDLSMENEKMTSGGNDTEVALNESKVEHQKLNENYQKVLEENNTKMDQLQKEGTQFRKQITAFEKKVVMQEREKKALEKKVSSFDKQSEGQKEEIANLKEKCESYDWKNKELEIKVEALRNIEETSKTYTERNQELLSVIEEATREKNNLLAKQALLMEKNRELRDERDTLKNERGVYESGREQDGSTHERKLETAQKKLKEKDRVLNETKKHCRQLKESEKELKERVHEKEDRCLELEGRVEELNKKLKHLSNDKEDLNEPGKQNRDLEESFEEKNKQCLDLEGRLEHMNKDNTKLKQLLQETKTTYREKEHAWQEEMVRQKNTFARELENVQENMEQSAQVEISRLTQETNENDEIRRETSRLSQENHALKIRLDDLGIEVSKEKEDKYKMEKLKDQFRFQMQSLQERFDAEKETMAVLQNEQLRGEKRINEERNKLLETLNEYESKNTKLISDIDKASSVLITTKEKYVKLKEKYNTLAKKYTKLNKEKLNKSDVQVGPDTSVDLSLVVEDLQRSKETAEETNLKLRTELDRLHEEIGRSEYQVKAVRKANVVLMKQSRCLYQESEEQKRLDEERTQELHKYREMKESLQNEKDTLTKEREMLEEQVKKLQEETARLKQENDEYFLAKNRTEIKLGDRASECVLYSRQLERLKGENEFLYQQGRKLQAELDVIRMKSTSRITSKPDEYQNFSHGFDKELIKHKGEMGTIKDFGTGKLSQGSKLSESTNSFDEVRDFTPPVFNNEKVIGDKVIESSNDNIVTAKRPSPTSNKTYSGKDTNLQISRNIINNDFVTEKYLGKTYWDTLEFLKKK